MPVAIPNICLIGKCISLNYGTATWQKLPVDISQIAPQCQVCIDAVPPDVKNCFEPPLVPLNQKFIVKLLSPSKSPDELKLKKSGNVAS